MIIKRTRSKINRNTTRGHNCFFREARADFKAKREEIEREKKHTRD